MSPVHDIQKRKPCDTKLAPNVGPMVARYSEYPVTPSYTSIISTSTQHLTVWPRVEWKVLCFPKKLTATSWLWVDWSAMTYGSPNRDLRRVYLWPLERLDPGRFKPPGSRRLAWGWEKQARKLLIRWEHLLAHSDLRKMFLIKHQIKLTDRKAHQQEVLDIDAICKLHSPWASAVV